LEHDWLGFKNAGEKTGKGKEGGKGVEVGTRKVKKVETKG